MPQGQEGNAAQTGPTLSACNNHTCAIDASGALTCWGSTTFGVADFPAGETWTAVASGWRHVCGLTAGGEVKCWGSDLLYDETYNGQVASLPAGQTWIALSAGSW